VYRSAVFSLWEKTPKRTPLYAERGKSNSDKSIPSSEALFTDVAGPAPKPDSSLFNTLQHPGVGSLGIALAQDKR
jgi:hypothetical protein